MQYNQSLANINTHSNILGMSLKWPLTLKLLMEEAGETQETLAEKLNISQGMIGHYINNRRNAPVKRLEQLANIFNTSVNYLLYGEEKKSSPRMALQSALPFAAQLPLLENSDTIVARAKHGVLPENYRSITMRTDENNLGKKAYCMDVTDEAALAAYLTEASKFAIASRLIAIIDPDWKPQIKKGVVCLIEGKAKVRQYLKDGDEFIVRSYDQPFTQMKFSDVEFLGTIVDIMHKRFDTSSESVVERERES